MRSKGKTADGIVVLRYYNVLFYLFFRAEVDDFKRQCLVNRIDAGESIRMNKYRIGATVTRFHLQLDLYIERISQ